MGKPPVNPRLDRSDDSAHSADIGTHQPAAQRYVLRELRVLYDQTQNADLRRQIEVLEAAFRLPNPRRIKREGVTGEALLD